MVTIRWADDAVDVAMIVDHKWRDLPGMAALAVWLEDRFGLSTHLFPYDQWRPVLLRRRPQAIVLTHVNGSRNQAIARLARELGTRVVVIQTEGRPNNTELLEYMVGHSAVGLVDLWFAWSETVRDYMLERGVLPEEKVVVAGSVRFDFYRPVLNRLIQPRPIFARRHGLDPGRPIVTWATNFTCAKFYRRREMLIADWRDLGLSRFPSYSSPAEFARMDYEARELSLQAVRRLLRARPDVQLVLKPHPTEEHDRYQAYVAECHREFGPRVVLVADEYIWDVLSAADVHLHRMCTTGVEAWLLGVPAIELHLAEYFAWSTRLDGAASEAVAGSDLVRDAEALVERVEYYLGGGKPSLEQVRAQERYVARWLYRVDGGRCAAHARLLAESLRERRPVKWRPTAAAGAGVQAAVKRQLGALRARGWRISTWTSRAPVDRMGQVDRRISQRDVDSWKQKVRSVLALRELGSVGCR